MESIIFFGLQSLLIFGDALPSPYLPRHKEGSRTNFVPGHRFFEESLGNGRNQESSLSPIENTRSDRDKENRVREASNQIERGFGRGPGESASASFPTTPGTEGNGFNKGSGQGSHDYGVGSKLSSETRGHTEFLGGQLGSTKGCTQPENFLQIGCEGERGPNGKFGQRIDTEEISQGGHRREFNQGHGGNFEQKNYGKQLDQGGLSEHFGQRGANEHHSQKGPSDNFAQGKLGGSFRQGGSDIHLSQGEAGQQFSQIRKVGEFGQGTLRREFDQGEPDGNIVQEKSSEHFGQEGYNGGFDQQGDGRGFHRRGSGFQLNQRKSGKNLGLGVPGIGLVSSGKELSQQRPDGQFDQRALANQLGQVESEDKFGEVEPSKNLSHRRSGGLFRPEKYGGHLVQTEPDGNFQRGGSDQRFSQVGSSGNHVHKASLKDIGHGILGEQFSQRGHGGQFGQRSPRGPFDQEEASGIFGQVKGGGKFAQEEQGKGFHKEEPVENFEQETSGRQHGQKAPGRNHIQRGPSGNHGQVKPSGQLGQNEYGGGFDQGGTRRNLELEGFGKQIVQGKPSEEFNQRRHAGQFSQGAPTNHFSEGEPGVNFGQGIPGGQFGEKEYGGGIEQSGSRGNFKPGEFGKQFGQGRADRKFGRSRTSEEFSQRRRGQFGHGTPGSQTDQRKPGEILSQERSDGHFDQSGPDINIQVGGSEKQLGQGRSGRKNDHRGFHGHSGQETSGDQFSKGEQGRTFDQGRTSEHLSNGNEEYGHPHDQESAGRNSVQRGSDRTIGQGGQFLQRSPGRNFDQRRFGGHSGHGEFGEQFGFNGPVLQLDQQGLAGNFAQQRHGSPSSSRNHQDEGLFSDSFSGNNIGNIFSDTRDRPRIQPEIHSSGFSGSGSSEFSPSNPGVLQDYGTKSLSVKYETPGSQRPEGAGNSRFPNRKNAQSDLPSHLSVPNDYDSGQPSNHAGGSGRAEHIQSRSHNRPFQGQSSFKSQGGPSFLSNSRADDDRLTSRADDDRLNNGAIKYQELKLGFGQSLRGKPNQSNGDQGLFRGSDEDFAFSGIKETATRRGESNTRQRPVGNIESYSNSKLGLISSSRSNGLLKKRPNQGFSHQELLERPSQDYAAFRSLREPGEEIDPHESEVEFGRGISPQNSLKEDQSEPYDSLQKTKRTGTQSSGFLEQLDPGTGPRKLLTGSSQSTSFEASFGLSHSQDNGPNGSLEKETSHGTPSRGSLGETGQENGPRRSYETPGKVPITQRPFGDDSSDIIGQVSGTYETPGFGSVSNTGVGPRSEGLTSGGSIPQLSVSYLPPSL